MVLGSHANTRAMYSTPPCPSLAASRAAYRRRPFSDNHPKKRCIFSSISAEYTSMLDSLSQNLCCRKDTTAQACREVILDHILSVEPLCKEDNMKTLIALTLAVSLGGWMAIAGAQQTSGSSPATGAEMLGIECP